MQKKDDHDTTPDSNDPNGQLKIFRKVRKAALRLYKVGNKVEINGLKRKGVINFIHTTLDSVKWQSGRPHFIEVTMDDEAKVYLCSPFQIKKVKEL